MASSEPLFLPPLLQEPEEENPNLYRRMQRFWSSQLEASPPMSPMERETLNPCEKLRRFGKIPWKLSIHTALVFATTWMVYMWSQNDATHIRHSFAHFHRNLLKISGMTPEERKLEIATASDLTNQLDSTVSGYWSIGDSKLSNYSLCKDPLILEVVKNDDITETVALNAESWQTDPVYLRITRNISPDIQSFAVKGTIHDRFEGIYFRQCLRWYLTAWFRYGGTGLVIGSLEYKLSECAKDGSTNIFVPLCVIVLAILSAVLCSKAEYTRKRRSMHAFTDGSISGWFVTNLIANLLQVAAGFSCMRLTHRMDVDTRFALIGLAAVTAWICVLRYLRYFHMYYLLVKTLSRAVPRCLRFVTGVSPILVGYALLGNCLFHQSKMFATIGGSVATLFSLLNGDIIRDTFSDICQLRPGWGEIYLYSFLCLFIYVVLHVFISIVEEAYFSAKHQEPPSETMDTHFELSTVEEENAIPLMAESSGADFSQYIVINVRQELQLLKRMGALDRQTKTQLSQLLT